MMVDFLRVLFSLVRDYPQPAMVVAVVPGLAVGLANGYVSHYLATLRQRRQTTSENCERVRALLGQLAGDLQAVRYLIESRRAASPEAIGVEGLPGPMRARIRTLQNALTCMNSERRRVADCLNLPTDVIEDRREAAEEVMRQIGYLCELIALWCEKSLPSETRMIQDLREAHEKWGMEEVTQVQYHYDDQGRELPKQVVIRRRNPVSVCNRDTSYF